MTKETLALLNTATNVKIQAGEAYDEKKENATLVFAANNRAAKIYARKTKITS